MKATIGVYESHEKAVKALGALKKANFPLKNVSIIGNAEMVDDHIHVKSLNSKEIGASIGVVAGSVLGILTGVGVFAIPGLGFLYGAGMLVGAMAGLDFGIIGGGLLAILAIYGVKDDQVIQYDKHLKEGKCMVIAQGDESEVNKAKEILQADATHIGLEVH